MAEKREVYKCDACGIVIEVLHEGPGTLVCCQQDMRPLVENTTDAAKEKHVPVVEKTDTGVKVKVGSVPHPMTAEHLIEWIEIVADGKVFREYLKPGQAPEATFCLCFVPKTIEAREYCNLHGLWKA